MSSQQSVRRVQRSATPPLVCWAPRRVTLRSPVLTLCCRRTSRALPRARSASSTRAPGFAMNWHVELIAAKLAAVRAGQIRRLLVSLPPRHPRSRCSPRSRFRRGASGTTRRRRSSASAMRRISPTNSRAIAAGSSPASGTGQTLPTRLSPQRAAMPEFVTTAQGCRLATSVGGVLTGRGIDPSNPLIRCQSVETR